MLQVPPYLIEDKAMKKKIIIFNRNKVMKKFAFKKLISEYLFMLDNLKRTFLVKYIKTEGASRAVLTVFFLWAYISVFFLPYRKADNRKRNLLQNPKGKDKNPGSKFKVLTWSHARRVVNSLSLKQQLKGIHLGYSLA